MSHIPGLLCRSIDRTHADVLAAAGMAITHAGAEIMAIIDHSAAAKRAGLRLRPTTLLMFGNPAGGTRLMELRPDSAIDLPMKLLIVEDDDGSVRILGEDPEWIVARHGDVAELKVAAAGMRHVMLSVLEMMEGQEAERSPPG